MTELWAAIACWEKIYIKDAPCVLRTQSPLEAVSWIRIKPKRHEWSNNFISEWKCRTEKEEKTNVLGWKRWSLHRPSVFVPQGSQSLRQRFHFLSERSAVNETLMDDNWPATSRFQSETFSVIFSTENLWKISDRKYCINGPCSINILKYNNLYTLYISKRVRKWESKERRNRYDTTIALPAGFIAWSVLLLCETCNSRPNPRRLRPKIQFFCGPWTTALYPVHV